ncbi:putative quinol monooxygenase [Pseudomonadota bacterium]
MLRPLFGSTVYLLLFFGLSNTVIADTKLRDGTVLSDKPFFIVTYIEVASASTKSVVSLIKQQRSAGQKQKGSLRFEALQRMGRKNHFVILEAWTDPTARDIHAKAKHTITFRKALQPHLYNPYDERPHVGLVAAEPKKIANGDSTTIYAVTHVDIIPPEQFPPCKRQVNAAGPCGNKLVEQLIAAGRQHKGNLRFDALTQANRSNHMTVIEMWESLDNQDAHTISKKVKDFREALSGIVPGSGVASDPLFVLNPLTGSLYDERLYKSID